MAMNSSRQSVLKTNFGVDEFVMKPFTSEILIEKLMLIGVNMSESQTI